MKKATGRNKIRVLSINTFEPKFKGFLTPLSLFAGLLALNYSWRSKCHPRKPQLMRNNAREKLETCQSHNADMEEMSKKGASFYLGKTRSRK